MSELSTLQMLLAPAIEQGGREMSPVSAMDALLAELQKRIDSSHAALVPSDIQLAAVTAFWSRATVSSFRELYILSSALCLRHPTEQICVMEDEQRFQAVLGALDEWKAKGSAYRRCFLGLIGGYFSYDALANDANEVGAKNWKALRSYLAENLSFIDTRPSPGWVGVVNSNATLFCEEPCAEYAVDSLEGDSSQIDHIYTSLSVPGGSWFPRALFFKQLQLAASKSHASFKLYVPRLLEIVQGNLALRHQGLALLVDRYAQIPEGGVNAALRDAVVSAWGNPWLPSNEKKWGTVSPEARSMVADWLKLEFIETFFTKLADDGVGDTRRLEFWKRYVKTIENIQFGLGPTAFNSRAPDFVELRKKMRGLISEIRGTGSDNNAFIMTMGPVVVVEFGSTGNAMYAYATDEDLPFELNRPLVLGVDAPNSLKHSRHRAKWGHKDGVHGWSRWEKMFESSLKHHFSIEPSGLMAKKKSPQVVRAEASEGISTGQDTAAGGLAGQWAAGAAAMKEYSFPALRTFAGGQELIVEDLTAAGGNLWVRTDDDTDFVNAVLTRWGFRYKEGKGWWRKTLHD